MLLKLYLIDLFDLSVYKLSLLLGFIASDILVSNALALNNQLLKLYQNINSESEITTNANALIIQNRNILEIETFREILIKDNVNLDIKLSNFVSEGIEENPSDSRISVDILSDINYEENGIFHAEGNVVLTMQNGILNTDKLSYDRANKILIAEGNITFFKGNQFFEASLIQYDFKEEKGFVYDIYGVMDFDRFDHDLNIVISEDIQDSCDRENIDLINLPAEVGLLNSNNIRFKNQLSLDSFKFDFSAITRWRFKSERIDLDGNKFSSDLIVFTNDPYNEPQFFITIKGFQGEIIDGKKIFKSNSTSINFDNKISIPIGSRTISDSDPTRWGFGYDSKNYDGLFLMRNFDPLFKESIFKVDLQPYFLLQRSLIGNTNSFREIDSSVTSDNVRNDINLLDLFAMDINIESEFSNSFLNIMANFRTLNPDKFYDSISLNVNFLRNLYFKNIEDGQVLEDACDFDPNKFNTSTTYKSDLGVYGIFDQDGIYSAYGAKIINEYKYLDNNLSRNYSLILDTGNFQGESLSDSNVLISLERYSLSSSFTHNYKIFNFKESEYNDNFNYTPSTIDQGIFITANISSGFNYYSNSTSQSILQASIGPVFVYGDLKDRFLDYTYISLLPEYSYKRGESPFAFDDFNNDSRLIISIKQQLFGPLLIGFESNLNLNSDSDSYGNLENVQYSLGITRRAYSVDFIYDKDDEYLLLNFNIYNFGYDNFSSSF